MTAINRCFVPLGFYPDFQDRDNIIELCPSFTRFDSLCSFSLCTGCLRKFVCFPNSLQPIPQHIGEHHILARDLSVHSLLLAGHILYNQYSTMLARGRKIVGEKHNFSEYPVSLFWVIEICYLLSFPKRN